MAFLWPKHGPHMVLKISSSWILINVPRDVPCQIQSPSIYIIRYFQLFDSVTQLLRHSVTNSVTYPRCRAVHLTRDQGHSYTPHRPPLRPKNTTEINNIKSDSYLTLNLHRSSKVIACHIRITNAFILTWTSLPSSNDYSEVKISLPASD